MAILKSNDEILLTSFCFYKGKEFQKSALPTLFNFVGVRAAHQPHVYLTSFSYFFICSFLIVLPNSIQDKQGYVLQNFQMVISKGVAF